MQYYKLHQMGSIQWHVNRYPKNYFLVVHRIWNLQSPNPQPHLQPYPQQERLFIMLVSSCPLNRLVYMSASQWTDWSAESPSTESTQPLASFTLYCLWLNTTPPWTVTDTMFSPPPPNWPKQTCFCSSLSLMILIFIFSVETWGDVFETSHGKLRNVVR